MERIVTVGFDRSEGSYAAARWAAVEAERRHARLSVVCCYHVPVVSDLVVGWVPGSNAGQIPTVEGDPELTGLRDQLIAAHPGLRVDVSLVPGSAWLALSDPERGSELVVVGATERSGAAAFWLGRTPRGVVRHARCPVVVVRGNAPTAERVVVGVDGSAASDVALEWAAHEADLHRAPLKVVYVWQYPYAPIGAAHSEPRDRMEVDAACVLEAAVQRAREICGGTVEGELLEGSAAIFLPTTVETGDLLVLGTRGRGAVRAGLFGSTVNSVLDEVSVSVAVVPAPHT